MTIHFKTSNRKLVIYKNKNVLIDIDAWVQDFNFYTEDIDWSIASQIFQSDVVDIPNGLEFATEMKSSVFSFADWLEFKKQDGALAKISITFHWDSWDKPATIHDFLDVYKKDIDCFGYTSYIIKEDNWVSLVINCPLDTGIVQDSLDRVIKLAKERYHFVVAQIHKEDASKILVKVFDFPKEYEVACTQYVIWFGEFLSSLGIDATVSTKKSDGTTNVLISPVDAPELLDAVEQLFSQYLALPYIDYVPLNSQQLSTIDRANVQQLVNQVENFKNQIQMKNAILELKNVTINQLKSDLAVAHKDLILLDSLIEKPNVEIMDSGISLTSWQWGIFKVEPKKLLRKLAGKV